MEKNRGPRRRQLVIRVDRDVFYRLKDKADALGYDLYDLLSLILTGYAYNKLDLVCDPDQEVSE